MGLFETVMTRLGAVEIQRGLRLPKQPVQFLVKIDGEVVYKGSEYEALIEYDRIVRENKLGSLAALI